jgi:Xaa-Pro aminopeptidase
VDHALRRTRLADRVAELHLDAVYVTRAPNVRYLTGFTGSNAQTLVGGVGSMFFTDGRYEEQSRHEVPDLDRRIYLDGSPPVAEAASQLQVRRLGFESGGVTYRQWERLRDAIEGAAELIPVDGAVEALRRRKDEDEIALIDAAQGCADVAFEQVIMGDGLRAGITERELALDLELAMRRAGADDTAFDTIAAFGEHAAEPHHHPTDRPLGHGDMVKVDFGALAAGYHSDMTRTVAFGDPGPRLCEIRDVVAAAQGAGIAAVRPGASVAEVDGAARSVIEEAGYGSSFPHGLGHGVGLEIHEAPFLRWDLDEVLEPGMVVTIEPGVYIPGLGGVRIEDMVEVTADGRRPIPRSSKELRPS